MNVYHAPLVELSGHKFKAHKGKNDLINDENITSLFLFEEKDPTDVCVTIGHDRRDLRFGTVLHCRFQRLITHNLNDKKCKPIPSGYRIGYGGMLRPENKEDESNGKKGGSNGNGNGNGGNGNGHGGNGNGGNGGGNGGGE